MRGNNFDSFGVGDVGDFFLGDLGEDFGDDDFGDDDLGDLVSGEVGRMRRRQKKRLNALAKKSGNVVMSRTDAAKLRMMASRQLNQSAQFTAGATGVPQTTGNFLAASTQRIETLPIGSVTLAAAAGQTAVLTVNVQRALQVARIFLQASDSTTGTNQLFSVGLTAITLGAHNLFNTPGTTFPATAFTPEAWGSEILSIPLGQGGQVVINFVRLATVANPSVVAAGAIGYSAG